MILAAALAAFSALLGGALAIGARRRPALLERTRTFAFAAAAGVVAFHLLPEILPEQGLAAIGWIALGFLLPWGLEAGARLFGKGFLADRGFGGARVAAEVGFLALLFHSLVEGLALVAALEGPGKLDLEIALVAHHAPLTAAVVLPFLDQLGAKSVARRAAIVGATGVAGVLLSRAVPGLARHDATVLLQATAVTAGALLHVVADEIRPQHFASGWGRAADVVACVAGLLVAGLGAALQARDHAANAPLFEFLGSVRGLSLLAAGPMVAGLAAVAVVGRGRLDAALLAAVLLGPLPALAVFAASFAVPGTERSVLVAVRDRIPRVLVLAFIAAAILSAGGEPRGLAAAVVLGVLVAAARLDEAGAVLVAAVLVREGVHPALAVGAVTLGPTLRDLRSTRAALLSAAALLAGVAAGALGGPPPLGQAPHLLEAAALMLLLLVSCVTIWQAGVRAWFAPIRHRS